MKKIVTIIGTRPEIIKMSPLLELLSKKFSQKIIHTGQHYDENMNRGIYRQLNLPRINYYLNVKSGSFSKQSSVLLKKIEEVLVKEKPDCVIVQGDTNTSMCGALVARRLNIKLLHVEAGCRSGNMNAPEEQNRIIIDALSDILFCADRKAYNQSLKEGYKKNSLIVGSTTFDALKRSLKLANKNILKILELKRFDYIIVTIHRAEGMWDKNEFQKKMDYLESLTEYKEVVFAIHPRTRKYIKSNKIKVSNRIKTIPPATYLDFIVLLKNCYLVVSDSGGIQEEAAFFNKPCLILRTETEWTRLVKIGKNFLIKNFSSKYIKLTKKIFTDKEFYDNASSAKDPESVDGASKKIVRWIDKALK